MAALLDQRVSVSLAQAVAARVLEVSAGNPLTLLELPLGLTSEQRLGREGTETILHDRASAEEAFVHRLARLPDPARGAVLVASLDEEAELETVLSACRELGIGASGSARRRQPACSVSRTREYYSATRSCARRPCMRLRSLGAAPRTQLWPVRWPGTRTPIDAPGTRHERPRRRRKQSLPTWPRPRGGRATGALTAQLHAPSSLPRASRPTRRSGLAGSSRLPRPPISRGTSVRRSTTWTLPAPMSPPVLLRTEIEHLRGRVTARMGSAAAAYEILVAAADRCERGRASGRRSSSRTQ